MKNTTLLDASVLLDTPLTRAREIFCGDAPTRKTLYRRLISHWHPDHNADPRAHEVFIHLSRLFESIQPSSKPQGVIFQADNGRTYSFDAQDKGDFELGQWYRGKGSVVYATPVGARKAHDNFVARANGLSYARKDMEKQIRPCMPRIHSAILGPDGQLLVLKRDPESICLEDVLSHYHRQGDALDPRHVGWIVGSLHHLACYLEQQGIAHQAISLGNVWINPQQHRSDLIGGWFHAAPFGSTITSLPAYSVRHAPRSYLDARVAGARIDLECIRGIGRALFGDPSGMRMHPSTPSALSDALRLPAHGSAIEEYRRWQQALHASFGPPKFVEMKLSFRDIYQGE